MAGYVLELFDVHRSVAAETYCDMIGLESCLLFFKKRSVVVPGGRVDLSWNELAQDWEVEGLHKDLPSFKFSIRQLPKHMEIKWKWHNGAFRSEEVDTVLGDGLVQLADKHAPVELSMLGGEFRLALQETGVVVTMGVCSGEEGGLWMVEAPYEDADTLLTSLKCYIEENWGKAI